MVNLTVVVFDEEGHPVTDLKGDDFTVIEDGAPQNVSFAGSEEVPFNLVLLLDLSGSTRDDREAMREAARHFVEIARPIDRVAIYALASDVLRVASPLTLDHDRIDQVIDNIPEVSGGTPLYDIIVLAYAQELRDRPTERNAIIVISDGVDNRVHGIGTASDTSIDELLRAAEGMNTLIYPVFLDPFTVTPPPGWAKKARRNLEELAAATGGRLFTAQSIRDLDPVYPLVADELRGLYTVNYYPSNQHFDGEWRNVQVRVGRSGTQVRTRDGYFGR
jgi:VWFA-related protein